MKEKELRENANCAICKKPFGHTGLPMFWRVKIERHGLNANAVRRQAGLGMMIGPQLAMVMGPDEEMTKELFKPVYITICEKCIFQPVIIPELAEKHQG